MKLFVSIAILGLMILASPKAMSNQLMCTQVFSKEITPAKPSTRVTQSALPIAKLLAIKNKKQSKYLLTGTFRFTKTFKFSADGQSMLKTIHGAIFRDLREITYEYENHFVTIMKPEIWTEFKDWDKPASPNEVNQHFARKADSYDSSKTYASGKGRAKFQKAIFEQLSMVLERYKKEKNWPNSFLRRLVGVAFKYAFNSTFVVVQAKNPDGTPGEIIGTVRLVSTPYLNATEAKKHTYNDDRRPEVFVQQKLHSEQKQFSSELAVEASELPKSQIWKEVFEGNRVEVDKEDLQSATPVLREDFAFVRAPFEEVLHREYTRDRRATSELQYFVEPGNFAIKPDRELPAHLRGLAAPSLYFHLARLIRKEAGAHGRATHIGTYASEGSTSDRFYQSLGFKVKEVIAETEGNNPTRETWNVLMGDGSVLETAFKKRFRIADSASLDKHFEVFDQYEKQWQDNIDFGSGDFVPN